MQALQVVKLVLNLILPSILIANNFSFTWTANLNSTNFIILASENMEW